MATIQLNEWHKGKPDMPINVGAIDQVIEMYEVQIKNHPDDYQLIQCKNGFISILRRLKDMGQDAQALIDQEYENEDYCETCGQILF